ncbi:MAG TPA: acetoin utilization protein AcuC [Actinomycetota bacterium]|nr:acetoin utilization protein AcuC [Actinomycetota bacterium]
MSEGVALVRCPEARIYDHGPGHPLRPDRVLLTWELIGAAGLDARPGVEVLGCEPAPDDVLGLVHTDAFIEATKAAGEGVDGSWGRYGYGPGDNPIFERMHEAGALVAGASVTAAEAVWRGTVQHAFNAAGGLHHAMPARASGFCVYDDPAIAIAWLLREGAERIAYVDVDVHHGDGVQAIFWDDPRVLTISIHQYLPGWFFPGTGGLEERGGPAAPGSAINIPLPPDVGDDAWLEVFRAVIPPAVERFGPDVLVTQLGCDTHASDPLAQLRLTTRAYRECARDLHALAHRASTGRWIATGGGGYEWARVVPRAWTLAFAEMVDALDELPDELPEAFVEEAERRSGAEVPSTFSEPDLGPGSADHQALAVAAQVRAEVLDA